MISPLLAALVTMAAAADPVIIVDRDDVVVDRSCTLRFIDKAIPDHAGDGVVRITRPGVTVRCEGVLSGAADDATPDTYTGTGIRIDVPAVTLEGARVRGFKAAVVAVDADGLVVEDCDLSGNFRTRLASTPRAEATGDWLWPHRNDDNEWLADYGAALWIEDTTNATVRRVRVRDGQNGILLDRVASSRVYDNDCSFLSGWGLALWRSSGNLISRNAFDFCVRGYSHEVYNRGQDSAGILLFEQCCDNVIIENSATHGGDGVFAFAGREALGEASPREDLSWYTRRGNNRNLFVGNDLSYAAAHGLELTFSFDNLIQGNRMTDNAICGIWGGYSQGNVISENVFTANGALGYGLERGGINIEHGRDNRIVGNTFIDNRCGVHLWWDEDHALLERPWSLANHPISDGNRIGGNLFDGDDPAVHLRRTTGTWLIENTYEGVKKRHDFDDASAASVILIGGPRLFERPEPTPVTALGATRPVGARSLLDGRQRIIMTEWGPYDWQDPLLRRVESTPLLGDVWELLGSAEPIDEGVASPSGRVRVERVGERFRVSAAEAELNALQPYRLTVATTGGPAEAVGVLGSVVWEVRAFASAVDPREDADRWRRLGLEASLEGHPGATLHLPFGGGGPEGLEATDHFGTIATVTLELPPGGWRLRTTSDDGIRVWLDDEVVIDDWTWHAPKQHVHDFEVTQRRRIRVRVEHFELDGYAILSVGFEPR